MEKGLILKSYGLWIGLIFIGFVSLFACQLPGQILDVASQGTRSAQPYPNLSETSEPYPQPGSELPYPQPGSDPAYPPSDARSTSSSSGSAYPGLGISVPSPEPSSGSAYPDPGSVQFSPTAVVLVPTIMTPNYPGPQVSGSPDAGLAETDQPSSTPVLAATSTPAPTAPGYYPGPDNGEPTAPPSGAYPAPVASPTSPSFQASSTPSPTSSSTPIFITSPTITLTSTPVVFQTATPTSTVIFYVTATSSPTPSPTITRTQVPPPPWINSQMHATDPSTVNLAAGRVQLFEFFAFWSGPSQAMAPLVHALEDQYAEQMQFVYLDIDDPANDYFKKELGYKKEPHFFLLDESGKISKQWIGYVSMGDFIEAFDAVLP